MTRTILALGFAALVAGCTGMGMGDDRQAGPAKVSDGVLTGPNGMTLYTFDKDTAGSGRSVCNGQCAVNWPPFYAEGSSGAQGNWTVVSRDDGRAQWAYKGKPLYYWVRDQKPGDRTGDGFNNAWRVVRP